MSECKEEREGRGGEREEEGGRGGAGGGAGGSGGSWMSRHLGELVKLSLLLGLDRERHHSIRHVHGSHGGLDGAVGEGVAGGALDAKESDDLSCKNMVTSMLLLLLLMMMVMMVMMMMLLLLLIFRVSLVFYIPPTYRSSSHLPALAVSISSISLECIRTILGRHEMKVESILKEAGSGKQGERGRYRREEEEKRGGKEGEQEEEQEEQDLPWDLNLLVGIHMQNIVSLRESSWQVS